MVLVYGFNEEDPDTTFSTGWTTTDANVQMPIPGEGEITPSEGENYMVTELGPGWANYLQTDDAMGAFDRWTDIQEIILDVQLGGTTSWAQIALIIQSGSGGWDQYSLLGINDAVDDWKTIVWKVDMAKHAPAFEEEGGWFQLWFATNNDAADAGVPLYIDNFRAAVTKETTSVIDWALY